MGRTSVAECSFGSTSILLEMKGTGVWPGTLPTAESHSNGLLSLECGSKEYLLGIVLPRLVKRRSGWRFAKVYGLVLLDVLMRGGKGWHPSVVLVREPSIRDRVSDLPQSYGRMWEITIDVEAELRRAGFTSCFEEAITIARDHSGRIEASRSIGGENQAQPHILAAILAQVGGSDVYTLDVLNVQPNTALSTENRAIVVDFEHFKFAGDNRELDVMALSYDQSMGFGGILPRHNLPISELSRDAKQLIAADWARTSCDPAIQPYLDRADTLGAPRYKQEIIRAYLESLACSRPQALPEALCRIEQRWLRAIEQDN